MEQPIAGYTRDEEGNWIAKLKCGHNQHVRHDPPWQLRPWVVSQKGRQEHIGHLLNCKKCDRNVPKDFET